MEKLIPTEELANQLKGFLLQMERGQITQEELTQKSIPLIYELNRRNSENNKKSWIRSEQQKVEMENLKWSIGLYRAFIHGRGLSEEFDRFLLEQVEETTDSLNKISP